MSKLLTASLVILACAGTGVRGEERLPDVRMLIDVSGSMRDSDPNNLREPALELMLRLLPDGSRAGVWTFGRWVNMPVAHREVDERWREEASAAVAQINNHGLLTNIPEALEKATYDAHRLDYRFKTSIILLTDGKVEISEDEARNARAARDVLEKLAIDLRDTGVEVHTIALSDDADREFLRQLAQTTGGLAEKAETADELSAVFLQALDIAAPTEQVPMLGDEFLIDDSVEEFTALVFPESENAPVTLVDPGDNHFTVDQRPESVRWFQHQRFQLITVANPRPGAWRIAAPGSIARVNIISHLTVGLDGPPTSLDAGHTPELGIRLLDSSEVIRDADLLGLVDISARIERSDGEQWDVQVPTAEVPASGEYRIQLPMLAQAGRYEIVVNVDGGSFQREQVLVTDVFEPVPREELVPPTQQVPGGVPGWLLPAVVPLVLVVVLLFWWLRQRRGPFAREHPDENDENGDIELTLLDDDDVAGEEPYLDDDDYDLEDADYAGVDWEDRSATGDDGAGVVEELEADYDDDGDDYDAEYEEDWEDDGEDWEDEEYGHAGTEPPDDEDSPDPPDSPQRRRD